MSQPYIKCLVIKFLAQKSGFHIVKAAFLSQEFSSEH